VAARPVTGYDIELERPKRDRLLKRTSFTEDVQCGLG